MSEPVQVSVWVIVDENGDYAVGTDAESATNDYEENVQELKDAQAVRRIKVTLTVPLPHVIELTGTVPAESSEGTLTVAE